jgi:hypothetical protein
MRERGRARRLSGYGDKALMSVFCASSMSYPALAQDPRWDQLANALNRGSIPSSRYAYTPYDGYTKALYEFLEEELGENATALGERCGSSGRTALVG